MEVDLQEQARKAAKGDGEALQELLVRYLPEVRAFVRLRAGADLRAHESCTDLVQSVCREILTHGENFQYPSEDAFKRWLYTTVLRKIKQRRRFWAAGKRRDDLAIPLQGDGSQPNAEELYDCYQSFVSPLEGAAIQEEVGRIETAFEQLSEEQREVVTLAHIVGLSRKEIAAEVGKSEGAVRVMLHRALVVLAELLDRPAERDADS